MGCLQLRPGPTISKKFSMCPLVQLLFFGLEVEQEQTTDRQQLPLPARIYKFVGFRYNCAHLFCWGRRLAVWTLEYVPGAYLFILVKMDVVASTARLTICMQRDVGPALQLANCHLQQQQNYGSLIGH